VSKLYHSAHIVRIEQSFRQIDLHAILSSLAQFHLPESIADENNRTKDNCDDQECGKRGIRKLRKCDSRNEIPQILEQRNGDAEEKDQLQARKVPTEMKKIPSKQRKKCHSAADYQSECDAFGAQRCECFIPVADLFLIHVMESVDRNRRNEKRRTENSKHEEKNCSPHILYALRRAHQKARS
jgi:hypothetical protein